MAHLYAVIRTDLTPELIVETYFSEEGARLHLERQDEPVFRVAKLGEIAEPNFFACATKQDGFTHVLTREAAMVAVRQARGSGRAATLYGVVPTKEGV